MITWSALSTAGLESSKVRRLRRDLEFLEGGFGQLLVLADQLGQIVRDRNVQLVDRAAAEVRARLRQLLELVQRVQLEEVTVRLRVGQIVARDVRQRGQSLVDVVLLRVADDLVRHILFVREQRLVIVVGRQVAVDHLGMVADTHLERGEVINRLN